ncbi:hypothetical protein [Ralstonia phage RSP15]|uniref:hypothetical protein n=1 Tax=Ralstonia phage RSP15 TaxID=1785960 RepID=UPI00074D2AC2|nr:hypothetical protein BH754_gp124 [Ralstonia phage RSP15]BAU40182.1 hypothetical protein [Ralstonia phage RSP15]
MQTMAERLLNESTLNLSHVCAKVVCEPESITYKFEDRSRLIVRPDGARAVFNHRGSLIADRE